MMMGHSQQTVSSIGYESAAGDLQALRMRMQQESSSDSASPPATSPTTSTGNAVTADDNIPVCFAAPEGFAESNAFGDGYRNYEDSARQDTVAQNYREDHTLMTYDLVCEKERNWKAFSHGEYNVWEVVELLDTLVDDSDPDNELPNSIHDFQTAERIREMWPGEEYDWFHLIGLLHDMGKVMALWGEPQWCVVGDTYPVGCKHSDKIVFPEFFTANPDSSHPVYSTENGVYKPGCGITNLKMAWGHDEYMYWMLKVNGCTLPEEGLQMIRYHSFYAWHTGGSYKQFEAPGDAETLKWVLEFNKFDLYSKGDKIPDVESLRGYYQGLLEKYNISGKLRW